MKPLGRVRLGAPLGLIGAASRTLRDIESVSDETKFQLQMCSQAGVWERCGGTYGEVGCVGILERCLFILVGSRTIYRNETDGAVEIKQLCRVRLGAPLEFFGIASD